MPGVPFSQSPSHCWSPLPCAFQPKPRLFPGPPALFRGGSLRVAEARSWALGWAPGAARWGGIQLLGGPFLGHREARSWQG